MRPGFWMIIQWLLNAVALMVTAQLVHGITITGFVPALAAALVLGLINLFLKPVLLILTLPASILTLGLFTLILNALLFWAGTGLVAGVVVEDFWAAFWGAIVYSILTWVVSLALSPRGTDTIVIKIQRRD
ncbi:phage holin family protein [Tepidiphilus margaritifer]|uniref:phage holin family protein n=1 Tax=Tepidiphilus margaritifer TaxID=203471 RepID=UPI00048D6B59|nr:phage holin family protein [Tepidiphilus margaritifer]